MTINTFGEINMINFDVSSDMGKNIFKLISQSFVISHFRPSYAYYNNTFGGSDV